MTDFFKKNLNDRLPKINEISVINGEGEEYLIFMGKSNLNPIFLISTGKRKYHSKHLVFIYNGSKASL